MMTENEESKGDQKVMRRIAISGAIHPNGI
jgi:hypothetical protein